MWSDEIEKAYQRWIGSPKLFGHPNDEERFYRFVWACIDNPGEAPDEETFKNCLANDWKLRPDAEGYPHPNVQKAGSLYYHLRAFAKIQE